MAISIVQPTEASVDTYLHRISAEQSNVDACVRLVDAECKFCISTYNHQRTKTLTTPMQIAKIWVMECITSNEVFSS
jgi:hypothetical protein